MGGASMISRRTFVTGTVAAAAVPPSLCLGQAPIICIGDPIVGDVFIGAFSVSTLRKSMVTEVEHDVSQAVFLVAG